MAVTRADVARLAGVSPAVVSYVINDGPRPVSVGARQRVEAAVARLGYRPNAVASALRGGSTHSIGYLTPSPTPFTSQMGESLERHLGSHGFIVVTGHTYGDRVREERYLRTFIDRKVDGLVVGAGLSLSQADLDLVEQPVIALEQARYGVDISVLGTRDDFDAARAVEHLQRHGHRAIGCITGPPHLSTASARIAGWNRQQRAAGNPVGDEYIAYADSSEEGGYAATTLMLAPHGRPVALGGRPPTALFVGSEIQAAGALYACHELRLRVPDDVAVVTMGGTRAAAYTIPALTTMRQDIEYLAGTAAQHLIDRIRTPSLSAQQTLLHGNLVVAQSCGC